MAAGFASRSNAPIIPIYYLALLAVIGILDSYSGFFAGFGFATAQIMLGQATSIRSFLILITLSLSWSGCVIFGEILFSMSKRDFGGVKFIGRKSASTEGVIILSSIFAGLLFYYLQFLAHSLSLVSFSNEREIIALSVAFGLLFIGRIELAKKLDAKLAGQVDAKIKTEEYEIQALFNPTAVIAIAIYFTSIIYVWTQSWGSALVPGIIMAIPFAALLIRFEKPEFRFLTKWKRNIYLEAIVVAAMSFGIHWIVSMTPNEVIHKSEILLAVGFIPSLFHAALSSLYDVTGNREVE